MGERGAQRRAGAMAAAALALAALVGCSAPVVSTGPSLDDGLHLAQIDRGIAAEDRALRTTRVAAPPANAVEWTVAAVDPASRDVHVSYLDGACTSADRLAVQETASAVTIGITAAKRYAGICSDEGIPRSTTVVLQRPLGGRALMERATGVNDGLPTVADPRVLPKPTCGSSDPSDAPAGMPDAAERMAPRTATTAFVCRTWWPKGSVRTASRTIADRGAVDALVSAVNGGVRSARPGPVPVQRCGKHVHGSWYAVYLEGPGLQVEVKVDGITCDTITNGARSGTASSALLRRLDALFG